MLEYGKRCGLTRGTLQILNRLHHWVSQFIEYSTSIISLALFQALAQFVVDSATQKSSSAGRRYLSALRSDTMDKGLLTPQSIMNFSHVNQSITLDISEISDIPVDQRLKGSCVEQMQA